MAAKTSETRALTRHCDRVEPDEQEMRLFHLWIESLCDSDHDMSSELAASFRQVCVPNHRRSALCCLQQADKRTCWEILQQTLYPAPAGATPQCARRRPLSRRNSRRRARSQSRQRRELSETQEQQQPHVLDGGNSAAPVVLEVSYRRGRLPHGYFRRLNENGDVDFFACFVAGHRHGPVWSGLIGGGFLVSTSLTFSSPNTVFLYPDCRTALVGTFERGQMKLAHLAEVVGIRGFCSRQCGTLCPVLANIDKSISYTRDLSTPVRLSRDPLLRDPYEDYFVYVGRSRLQNAGQGLFARVDMLEGTVVAFYNGIRVSTEDDDDDDSTSGSDDEDRFVYRIQLSTNCDLDMPKGDRSIGKYCATLGHKVAHSFTPNCEFDLFDHPRFGLIQCLATVCPVRQGEELTVNYGYSLATAPLWYKKLWISHQKEKRGIDEWDLALARHRNGGATIMNARR